MATALTDEQKQAKRIQDDLKKRKSEIGFPTNVQVGQDVPLMPIAKVPDTLKKAGEMATQGFTSSLQAPTQQIAKGIVENPSVINKEAELGKFDVGRSQATEEFRRATGGVAGSSDRNQALLKRFTSGAFDRAQLSSDLDRKVREEEIASFDVGQKAVEQERIGFRNQIGDLLNTAGTAAKFAEIASRERIQLNDQQFQAAQNELKMEHASSLQKNDINASRENLMKQLEFREGQALLGREFTAEQSALDRSLKQSLAHLDINGQREMITLQDKLSTNRLLTQQDFQEAQAALDRAFENSRLDKNIEAQVQLQKSQQEFNQLLQLNQQKWESAERAATQLWKSSERLSDQDHQKAIQYLDFKNKEALQANDTSAQMAIQEMKTSLALKLQTQEMEQQEKLMYLDSQLKEAAAGNDFERQKSILQLQTFEQMKILQEQGNQAESMALLNNKLNQSLADQNFTHTKILQDIKFQQETQMQMNEIQLQEAELALKEKGLDLQIDNMYNQWVQQAASTGQVSPESVYNWLQNTLPSSVKGAIKPPDPFAVQSAIKEDFLNMQLQYSMTHPDTAVYENGVFVGLNDGSLGDFNNWFNKNFYNNPGSMQQAVQKIYVNSKSKSNTKGPNERPPKEGITQSKERPPIDIA